MEVTIAIYVSSVVVYFRQIGGLCPIISNVVTDSGKDFHPGWSIRLCHSCAIESLALTPVCWSHFQMFNLSVLLFLSLNQNLPDLSILKPLQGLFLLVS